MNGLEDLEDDVESFQMQTEKIDEPRKLSRLRKGGNQDLNKEDAVKGIDTPDAEARSSLVEADLMDEEKEASEHKPHDQSEGDKAEEASVDDGNNNIDYWDEEDEIEHYLKRKSGYNNFVHQENEESGSDDESDTESDDNEFEVGVDLLGEGATLEDINAETQRILRETAARDRLGKGQKIEVKPLTGIVAKLRERRALAISRAPTLRAPSAPAFDDALAMATEQSFPVQLFADKKAGDAPVSVASTDKNAHLVSHSPRKEHPDEQQAHDDNAINQIATNAQYTTMATAADAVQDNNDHPIPTTLENAFDVDNAVDDLEVLPDDDGDAHAAEFHVVDLPDTVHKAPKPSPLAYMPFNDSKELDDFEDEPLVDDGAESDDDSDGESERSWEIKKNAEEEEEEEAGEVLQGRGAKEQGESDADADDSSDEENEEEMDTDDDEEEEEEDTHEEDTISAGNVDDDTSHKHADGTPASQQEQQQRQVQSMAALFAASDVVPKQAKRVQRTFFDMEAELSDEDGAAAAVSDDEDEDNLDDNGQLADLIADDAAGTKTKDLLAAEELHVQWAHQQDVKDLHKVLRGLENGFRRRPGMGLLDAQDAELSGRFRRARGDDSDLLGGVSWPSAFGSFGQKVDAAEEEEEFEDEAMLQRANQQRILAGSQQRGGHVVSPGPIPLDEDSQLVLSLLARSQSQHDHASQMPQRYNSNTNQHYNSSTHAHQGTVHQHQSTSAKAMSVELLGTEANAATLMRAPSFVGRQTGAGRAQKAGSLGLGSGRSFVFGRKESSNSGNGSNEHRGSGGSNGHAPVSFANLRQMTGMQGTGGGDKSAAGGSSPFNVGTMPQSTTPAAHTRAGNKKKIAAANDTIENNKAAAKHDVHSGKRPRSSGSTLMSRLRNSNSTASCCGSQDTLDAVYHQVVMGPSNRLKKARK